MKCAHTGLGSLWVERFQMVRRKNRSKVERRRALLVVGDADSALGLYGRQDFPVARVADAAAALTLAEPADYSVILVDLLSRKSARWTTCRSST